ncbi:MAG TPA: SNF2 helicase-associated domain-containing protein, partial [Candidatus Sulfotelmatobacter sp.]|nr:SNF2 helicase-associated domain-containing protein [Candidatus Sulfotelmatobacter sp.]
MIVLHGTLLGREFYLWGETSEAASALTKRGRKAKLPTAPALPFGATAQVLTAALRERFPSFGVAVHEPTSLIAWLPVAGTHPAASSPLIAPPPEPGIALSLGAWTVSALRLSPAGLIELLGACLLQETLAPGLVAGKDLNFWAQALRLASALATRQQFLPGLSKINGQWRAGWEAVFIGADAERLAKLARAMPPVCRGVSAQANVPPTIPAADGLKDFIHLVVDHLVRSSNLQAPGMALKAPALKSKARFDSLHDQWLGALRAPEGGMSGEEKDLAQLAGQVADWRRPISVTAAAPVKLCFRLEEPVTPPELGVPAEPGSPATPVTEGAKPATSTTPNQPEITSSTQPWHVRFLLQPADDPSLLVEAGEVWKKRSSQVALLRRGEFKPKEYLLSALGQAAGICPRLEASLKTTAPAGYKLDATGAHEFLTQRAWALEQAGFGVLLPAWWTGRGTKLRLSVRAKVKSPALQGGSGLSLEEIVKFDWEVALGDTTLTLAELETLAKLKAPLVKIRGQWVQLNAEEIRAAIDLWRQKASGQVEARVRDLVQMALGAKPAAEGLQFE